MANLSTRFSSTYSSAIAHVAVLLLCALPLFGHLDEAPVQVWDEMRNVQNALEMNQTGKLIVTTFDYKPEAWNTKPPLMIWLLALSQRLFGYNELAVRLPSALAGLFTCFLILYFFKRRLDSWFAGFLAVLVLITSAGYVAMHSTRTGDYDAVLTFFTTGAFLAFVNFVEESKRTWLWLSTISIILAVLTKGIAGVFICPGMLAYAFLRHKGKLLFSERTFYYCAGLFLLAILGYYGLRELQQPGYLKLVWENELGGRYNAVIESHQGDKWAYYNELKSSGFSYWMPYLLPIVLASPFYKDPRARRIALAVLLAIVSIFVLLNTSTTKIRWYLIPVYPFLAILYALFFYQFLLVLKRWLAPKLLWIYILLSSMFILFIGYNPYSTMLDITIGGQFYHPPPEINDPGMYLKEITAGKRALSADVLCGSDTYPFSWYKAVLRQRNQPLYDIKSDSLTPGMNVLVWEAELKELLKRRFEVALLDTLGTVAVYYIKGHAADTIGRDHSDPAL